MARQRAGKLYIYRRGGDAGWGDAFEDVDVVTSAIVNHLAGRPHAVGVAILLDHETPACDVAVAGSVFAPFR